MYRLYYSYYDRDEKTREPKGQPHKEYVDGRTVGELNRRFQKIRDNHNVFSYTLLIFNCLEEI